MDWSGLIDKLGGTAEVARFVGVRLPSVSDWRKHGVPELRLIAMGAHIERVAGIKRWELRPSDWHLIWPELVGTDGAPPVPAAQHAPLPERAAA
jgi:DNA-binding transcriptional regulator YdaS (Cro superfamily)